MEKPEFINCETEWLPDTEDSNTCEPDIMLNRKIDEICPEPDIKEGIPRIIKEEPLTEESDNVVDKITDSDLGSAEPDIGDDFSRLTEEIYVKSVPGVKVEQDLIVPKVERDIFSCEPYEDSGGDINIEVKDELNDISGSLKNDSWSLCGVTSEETSPKNKDKRLHSASIHKLPLKNRESPLVDDNVTLYICNNCFKGFHSKLLLKNHMATHSNERPFICSKCSRGFKRRQTLHVHMHSHSDKELYRCNKCGRGFKSSHAVWSHMLTHSDERPYICNTCGRRFTVRKYLVQHLVIHDKSKS